MMGMELSAYELKRLENIRQNQKILESLEIPQAAVAIETQPVKSAAPASSKKRPAREVANKPVLPTRVSSRIQQKLEEERTGKKPKKRDLLYELPAPVEKPVKPRPKPGTRIPFEPENGATEGFLKLMNSGAADVEKHPERTQISLSASTQMGLKTEGCVVKVLQDRIYSVVLHPSTDKIITATGSKVGQVAFWDATDVYYDNDTTFTANKPKFYQFHPHSGSVSTLRYNPGNWNQLLSSGYEGSIQCMDIVRGHFETVYSGPEKTEQYISTFDFFGPSNGQVIGFSDMSGYVSILDRRSPKSLKSFYLHDKKIGGMSISLVNPDLIATCSLDDTVCIWDARSMKAEGSVPLARFEYRRAVTAVNFHPTVADCLVSTCYDDNIRLHKNVLGEKPTELSVKHNNQTGRWITTFKAFWDPKSTSGYGQVIVGDMNRGIDLIDGKTGTTHNFTSDYLTAQPAVNGAHPLLDVIVSGNASGKLALWTPF